MNVINEYFEAWKYMLEIMPMWFNIMIGILMFVTGTMFGSFFTLATYRIPRKLDIVVTRSFCPNCKHRLEFLDLIPILSYIILRGKCKYCQKKISIRYPLFEMFTGVIFLLFYLILGFNLKLVLALTTYILLFIIIGSKIMKNKMLNEQEQKKTTNTEQNIMQKNKEKEINRKIKKSKKIGAFVSEIVIAFVLLCVTITTCYSMTTNYNINSKSAIYSATAVNIATKNMEIALATKYDELDQFSSTSLANGIMYNTDVEIHQYSNDFKKKNDYIKKIKVTVSYIIEGQNYIYEVTSLKKRV